MKMVETIYLWPQLLPKSSMKTSLTGTSEKFHIKGMVATPNRYSPPPPTSLKAVWPLSLQIVAPPPQVVPSNAPYSTPSPLWYHDGVAGVLEVLMVLLVIWALMVDVRRCSSDGISENSKDTVSVDSFCSHFYIIMKAIMAMVFIIF